MTKYSLNLKDFGLFDIDNLIDLLQTYRLENKKNSNVWINKVIYDNTIPEMYLIDDNKDKYKVEYDNNLNKIGLVKMEIEE
jgi:hypothetical protein